jgi:hypothetical protein
MASTSFELARTYSTFAGVDIQVVFGTELIGEMQALSYAVQREKAPLYVMGRVDPLAFSRGKRGIAGTIVSLLLDEHILIKRFSSTSFVADNHEIYANVTNKLDVLSGTLDAVSNASFDATDVSNNFTIKNPWYVDQIPPLDASIVAANEYGQAATMRIYGIEILNEGSGFSIDDIVIENQMTYVARTILPWQKLGSWAIATGGTTGPTQPFTSA